jgi:6-pyruvoyltetrahydropterin/6-carboxytetrahydropterin synthase
MILKNMEIRIAKDFKWEMSHRLPNHDGLCKNIHGHTYKMRLELTGIPNESGMLIDYFDIENIVRPFINKFDHGFVVDHTDSLLIDFLKNNNFKHFVIPFYSTAENLVRLFAQESAQMFAIYPNLSSVKIRIHETEDVFAEFEQNFNRALI